MSFFKSRQERDRELAEEGEKAKFQALRSAAETTRIEKKRNELAREQREWMRANPQKPLSEFPEEIMNKYKDVF